MIKKAVWIILAVLLTQMVFVFAPEITRAASATYYFSPSSIDIATGQTTTVSLYISSPGQSINSGSGTIVLPTSYLAGTSVSKAGSIFTLWTDEPSVSGSKISFGGGLSNPGYKGGSGKVLSFTIRGQAEGTGLITLNSGKILANDGNGTDIHSGSSSATVDVTRVVTGAAIASDTHPNQDKWYSASDVKLSWSKPAGTSSYSYVLSKPGADNISKSGVNSTSATFNNLADGIWTFKLTTAFSDGKSAISSFAIHIDTVAPSKPVVAIKLAEADDQFPTIAMSSTDEGSGIDHYEITLGGKETLKSKTNDLKLPKQLPGNHFYEVIAVDKAGNKSLVSEGKFFVEGIQGPVITGWPTFVAILQPIKLRGTALYGSVVQLYVDDKIAGEFFVSEFLSPRQERKTEGYAANEEVEWEYELKQSYASGAKTIFATQTSSAGKDSFKSNTVQVRVLSGWISLGGFIVPMPVLFWLSFLLLVLAVALIVFLVRRQRALIKRRLTGLKERVDKEMDELEETQANSDAKEEVAETKGEIDRDFDEAAK